MHKSGNASKILLAMALCGASLSGCGRKEATALSGSDNSSTLAGTKSAEGPAELPLEQQTEQKLDPLTREDVELYQKVMRAAAERVKNPQAGDLATLDGARKILSIHDPRRIPTSEDVEILDRANLVALYMDQIVAEDMKIDGRTYRGIAEAIESVVPNPASGPAPVDSATPVPVHAPTPLETRISIVNAANEKFLAPYREEVQRLIAVVRNPANVPK